MTDHVRRGLLQGFAFSGLGLALAATLPGCAAPGTKPAGRSYTETVTSVLISQDGRHLVAIGSGHHYIFDAPPALVQALQSPLHAHVTGIFTPFHVDMRNDIRGEVTLALAADAPDDAVREAERLGFRRPPGGTWEIRSALTGHRYNGWTYDVGLTRDRLNRSYTVEITSDETSVGHVVDEAGTPIRIAADGVQLIYYAPLAPVIIPMIFLLRARDH